MGWRIIKRANIGGTLVSFSGAPLHPLDRRGDRKSVITIAVDDTQRENIERFDEVRLHVDSNDLTDIWAGVARMYFERAKIDDNGADYETYVSSLEGWLTELYLRRRSQPVKGRVGRYWCPGCGQLEVVPLAGQDECLLCEARGTGEPEEEHPS